MNIEANFEPIYDFVRTVPAGKVVTYGQVAGCLSESAVTARMVGAALHTVPEGIPWQRVVGAGGTLPIHKRSPELAARQKALLEAEGVTFLPSDTPRIDMVHSQWQPPTHADSQGSLFAHDEETSN